MKLCALCVAVATAVSVSGFAQAAGPSVMNDAQLDQVVAGETLYLFEVVNNGDGGWALSAHGQEVDAHPGRGGKPRGGPGVNNNNDHPAEWMATETTCDTDLLTCSDGGTIALVEDEWVYTP